MTRPLDRRAGALLPLTPAVLHILLALADRQRHGLGIAADVESATSGRMIMGPGTLYGTIKRMIDAALIEATGEHPDDEPADPRRRYYRITPLGRRALELEAESLAGIVGLARRKRVLRSQ
jgi:DNA-binding PadR family transcriptional regulator